MQALEAAGNLPSYITKVGSIYEVDALNLSAGQSIILYSSSNSVKLKGDINFQDTAYSSLSDVPRFALLTQGAIFVDSPVRQLDGVYATNNRFMTCFPSGTKQVSFTHCNQPLTINGPVYAGPGSGVVVWRTHGAADGTNNQPAELFNLHPSTMMSEHEAPGQQLETVVQEELPPRF